MLRILWRLNSLIASLVANTLARRRVYQSVLKDKSVAVKIARLNILDGLQTVQLILFKSSSTTPSTSTNLGLSPRGMTMKTQLLYKWAMPALRELRYSVEKTTGQAIDMTGNTLLTRNELLFESAVPLAKLYDEVGVRYTGYPRTSTMLPYVASLLPTPPPFLTSGISPPSRLATLVKASRLRRHLRVAGVLRAVRAL